MEIIRRFRQNGYFTPDLYQLLANKKLSDTLDEIIPSEYEKEMKMDTVERLRKLNNIEVDNIIDLGKKRDAIVLSFAPKIIIFQNYKPNDRIVSKFSVKNISMGPTYLNMTHKDSSYFAVKPCAGHLSSRLAPGIGVTFTITFTPSQYEDYTHKITFYTDKDQYALPIIAIGPRPIFDFPDSIVIPRIPLKLENFVLITICNVGIVPAGFTFNARSPFSVQPQSVFLNPEEKIEVKIGLQTMRLGDINGKLFAMYETGEQFLIKLFGSTHTVKVDLEKEVVRFQETYNTMVRQQTIKITNRSNHVLTYMCMKNDCLYYDFKDKIKLATICYNLKESESAKYSKLVQYDVLSSEEHERVYTRIFRDEIHAIVADESLVFQNTHFLISPIKGQLWPNKTTELAITFAPKEIAEFQTTAFLDIDGVSDRVPLTMVGTSLPPSIQLNLETLDMDCVYINTTYNYEIIATNKGHINGVILYKEVPTLFGSVISCTPECHFLRPGDKQIFVVSFCNCNQGPYFEEINFVISDTKVVIKVYLKGEIICPTLTFSVPCLDFGSVSLGVPATLELEVINESVVQVNATVKIPTDGPEISSIRLTDYAIAEIPKPETPKWPREFDIQPSKISIGPESKVTLKVTLIANLIRTNQTSIEIELENSDSPPIVVPVTFDALVPDVGPVQEIRLQSCFLSYPYQEKFCFTCNEYFGYFTVIETESETTLEVEVDVKEGLIEPNSTICLPLVIKTSIIGEQESTVRLRLFGMSKPIDICHISALGVRPIITHSPTAIHWGQLKLLTKSNKTLSLCNDSPVEIHFSATLFNRDERWQIEPEQGIISPESKVEFIVSLCLSDAATYSNKVLIHLEKVKDILVPLSATGVGTSIVVGDLRDRIDLGLHFTKIQLNDTVSIKNCGTRMHSMEWTEHFKAPKVKDHVPSNFFSMDPRAIKIAAGEKLELVITGLSNKVTTIKENWYLVGSVEGINKKELLLECPVEAEFVDPKIKVSSTVVDFRYDFSPYSEYYKLTDIVTIKNVSRLPLDIDISVKPPFAIIERSSYKIPYEDENLCCCITYDENDLNIANIVKEVGYEQSKIFIDYLTLKPVEPLRKGPLGFFQNIHKIKMAFNLTNSVQEILKDQEVIKLQILFDTTKHLTLKSKVYHDIMKIKFKGHKNKDAIKLIGTINFPNVYLFPPKLEFQCILNGSIVSKTIKMRNGTPLLVCYRLRWKKICITTMPSILLPQVEDSIIKSDRTTNKETDISISYHNLVSVLHGALPFPTPDVSLIENIADDDIPTKDKETTKKTGEETHSVQHFADIDESEDNNRLKLKITETKTIKKVAPMLDTKYYLEFPWTCKFHRLSKSYKVSLNDIIKLTPHRGLIKPDEIQYIQVMFAPTLNIDVQALLECEVLGGPAEYVVVSGQSSDLIYEIESQKINFKTRSFHENAFEKVRISNKARLPFEYTTYLNEPVFENELEATIVELEPATKILDAYEEIEVKIIMRPGVVGYFDKKFLLEIGNLPHIEIEVFGWGVIPQIYLSIQRPDIIKLQPELGYIAIQTISVAYLDAIREIFNKNTEHLNSPITDKCYDDPDLQREWHVYSIYDDFPSIMDIELAIERVLVVNHIRARPDILTAYSTTTKMGPIPGFQTIPYVLDFGVVITGNTVQCVLEIVNYGPIAAKPHLAKGSAVPLWLNIKLCGRLFPGETGKLEIIFSPTSDRFPEYEQNVEITLNLEIPYGVTLPLQIKAFCAVPYLVSNVSSLDFGSVRCGDKVVCSIPLKNIGKPTCVWYATLRLKTHGPSPMTILCSSGKYEPEEGGWLSVAFKPTIEMTYEGVLIFRFHMNPNKITIPLRGQGIVPQVQIIGPDINFPPTLPWAETSEMFFGLTNPCPFPIELIITHKDKRWREEDEIYQLLYKYYNKPEEMLVPVIKAGKGLPSEIVNFYVNFKEGVKRCMAEQSVRTKSAAHVSPTHKKEKLKSAKNAPKSSTAREVVVKKIKTEAEIIADEMAYLRQNNVDPLKKCLQVFETSPQELNSEHPKGVLIFFHGSPCEEMQCQEMAYSVGRKLLIPTFNIDKCIVEALCVSNSPAKIILISAIDENYDEIRASNTKGKIGDVEDVMAEFEEDLETEAEDEFEVIWRKIEFLIYRRTAPSSKNKAVEKKKKTDTTITPNAAFDVIGSPTLFNMDLILELLLDYLSIPKFRHGFIVYTLTSRLIKVPSVVLTTLLRIKSDIRNIHLVLCHSDFSKWAQNYEAAQRERELNLNELNKEMEYNQSEIDDIVELIENMDCEEYENACETEKSIYIKHGLEERRRKYQEKNGYIPPIIPIDKRYVSKILASETSESKSKKTSKKEEHKAKQTSEYMMMSAKYNEYSKITYDSLINIANNWIKEEGELGIPLIGLNGRPLSAMQKKIRKKSESQLQIDNDYDVERGFPLTLIMCPCLQYKEALVRMFSSSPTIQLALKEDEELDVMKCSVMRKEYTVLMPKTLPVYHTEASLTWCYLDEKPIKKCECNQLTDFHLLNDTYQDNIFNILSKWHCICGKKVASSHTSMSKIQSESLERKSTTDSVSGTFSPLPIHSVKSMPVHGDRLILEPGDLIRCKYTFSPREEGNFSVKRFVEVSGWPESRVNINVSGICDLPRIDSRPKKMFENFTRSTIEGHVYKITYLDDLNFFQFGPIFVGRNRVYEEDYKIDLKNSSLLATNIDIGFQEDTIVFEIDQSFITLEPSERGKLMVTAAPADVGEHSTILLLSIKDNPEIVAVNIVCEGVVPKVDILPINKAIVYGKHLLYRRENERFIVKNDSILPVMWKIRNAPEFVADFIIAQTSGVVPSMDNQVVPVTYIACNVGVISNKSLIIDIYDSKGRGDPMLTITLLLSAECYDVLVECAFENPLESALNFGNVKVNSTVTKDMYLLNRGKYNVYYKLKKVKDFPEPSLLRSFEAIDECGVVPFNMKLVIIEFECTPTTSMNLVNVPAYTCTLLDGSKDQVVVAKFPVCVTIASFYNTFTLFPLGQLNFHVIPVGSSVAREVILNNTSKCPITYDLILPKEYPPDPATPTTAKLKDNRIKNPPLKCGNFTIINENNLLAPGSSRTIQINFLAAAPQKFEETIKFVISDTCPAEAQGVPLKLIGTGAMPTLDFWNLETTFREHLIVKQLSEYESRESSPHCVFEEDSVTLHFFSVTVNTNYTGYLDLYNNGLVACALTIKLHYQTNTNQDNFALDKYGTHIEPLMHKNIGIIFTPKALQEYRAVLEIKLKQLDNQEKCFKICLIGEGVIPRIKMISPKITEHKKGFLRLPVTCLGSTSFKEIRFKNISAVKSVVVLDLAQISEDNRPVFWITAAADTENMVIFESSDLEETIGHIKLIMKPKDIATLNINYNPIAKGISRCDIKILIIKNSYEVFVVSCEGEAFMEDVILIGLKMLSVEANLEFAKPSEGKTPNISEIGSKKRIRSAPLTKKIKGADQKLSKKMSMSSLKPDEEGTMETPVLKYKLNFGGCELCSMLKRCVVMANNSDKVYKFVWEEFDCIVVKPSTGYISPGEEKDLEIMFFSMQPGIITKEPLNCSLTAISDDTFSLDMKEITWDNRQTVTLFEHNRDTTLNERVENNTHGQSFPAMEKPANSINIIIMYSAYVEYSKYTSTLDERIELGDTFIYQKRTFDFIVQNIGNVPLKIVWSLHIDEDFPVTLDRVIPKEKVQEYIGDEEMKSIEEYNNEITKQEDQKPPDQKGASKATLFSGSMGRESVDTWFEVALPFQIEPSKDCLKPNESRIFKVTFAPTDAFNYRVRLKSTIDNLDPYDQNLSCRIIAKSLIPYCHLDIEESDYISSGRRKETGVFLPPHSTVLEFNVLGSGCYKKTFNVVNPTVEAYEFMFEMVITEKPEFVPVHCNKLKGFIEGGTSTDVTFTFSPTAPGVYESQWKFKIPVHNLVMHILVVGLVREPNVTFVPSILVITNSLVGFTTINTAIIKNNEDQSLKFMFKGDSLCKEGGETPVIVEPLHGTMKPRSETPVKISYTPIHDGPVTFKIYYSISFLTKYLTLCVNALSLSINPKVIYHLSGTEHILNSEADTNIHLDQIALTYERVLRFTIKNDGSATFFFDWYYTSTPVKKYLQVDVEPRGGRVTPGNQVECCLHFRLKQVPVEAYPVTLSISDGPEYSIYLYAKVKSPQYHFSCKEYDFGECIINAPDNTYKKNVGFVNSDVVPVIMDLNFKNLPELFVDMDATTTVEPETRLKIPIFFRPKKVKKYEFKLQYWVNSLCEEIMIIRGEGVPLLFDLYEGCQKSFDLGAVKVGEKIVHQIEVMNHSKVPIDATFIFRDMYPGVRDTPGSETTSVCLSPSAAKLDAKTQEPTRVQMLQCSKGEKIREQIEMDIKNALSSLKVVPSKCSIKPYKKVPLKIQFKPVGMINKLTVQLNMKVFQFERPLVRLSGSATGMSLCFSQDSLQFGRVRKRGCKILKVMLLNKGDFGARFCWQPLISDEFKISPMEGTIAAHTNVTFTITFRPVNHNPFIKVWASCNIENYKSLEIVMFATCVDVGTMQSKTIHIECPVREVKTEYITVTNPSDEMWLVLSEMSGSGPFETLTEFHIEANSTFNIPIHFKPKSMGKHEKMGSVNWKKVKRSGNYHRQVKCALQIILDMSDGNIDQENTDQPSIEAEHNNIQRNNTNTMTDNNDDAAVDEETSSVPAERQVLYSPLGDAVLFINLNGIALHPNPNADLTITFEAKRQHTEDMLVYNITEKSESYTVVTEMVKIIPDRFEGYYDIKYPETVKVWGGAAATCRWTIACYEQCQMILKVMFINEESQEYQFYNVSVSVTPSEILATLRFTARARELVQQELVVANPLPRETDFYVQCDKLECPKVLKISKISETTMVMTYSPLVVGEFEDYLVVKNETVGAYVYKVLLHCLPAKEKNLEYSAPLGSCIPLRLRVQNRTDAPANFVTTISHPSILAEKDYSLGPLEKGKFQLWFEPTKLGVQDCRVSFKSATAGEFVFNIKGTSTKPKPQGPLDIKPGSFATIKFKNVFEDTIMFKITIDREDFYVKSIYETVKSKKDVKILVYLNERPDEEVELPSGSLVIESFKPMVPKIQWTYFLQGVRS